MYYYLTALTIGLMGSLHCVGMCGPIALAVPLQSKFQSIRWLGSLNYLLGKAITYSLLGLFSGAFAKLFEVTGFQRYVSLIAGILILFIFLLQQFWQENTFLAQLNLNWVKALKIQFNKFIVQKNLLSSLVIGLINGILPCGLVYMAMAGAVGAGGWWQSMFYMFLFGIGTMPLLFAMMLFKNKVSILYRKLFQKLIPTFTIVIAVLLIVRGLNLGIPYFSPKEHHTKDKTTIECCSKPMTIHK
ncbi:MAG TPA: sulfite exporter TauE/SafE family protein [Bacteroidia bacterium]|nr:sulfite exporter TauE/SafE family protein [Bacteroidia bacterium]